MVEKTLELLEGMGQSCNRICGDTSIIHGSLVIKCYLVTGPYEIDACSPPHCSIEGWLHEDQVSWSWTPMARSVPP